MGKDQCLPGPQNGMGISTYIQNLQMPDTARNPRTERPVQQRPHAMLHWSGKEARAVCCNCWIGKVRNGARIKLIPSVRHSSPGH